MLLLALYSFAQQKITGHVVKKLYERTAERRFGFSKNGAVTTDAEGKFTSPRRRVIS